MPEEQEEDARVEQVAPPAQQASTQQLGRVAFPAVLVLVEADEAPRDEYAEAHVWIDLKEKTMQHSHELVPCFRISCLRTMRMGFGPPGRAWPLLEHPSKAAGSSQFSSTEGSDAGFTARAFSPAMSRRAASTLA